MHMLYAKIKDISVDYIGNSIGIMANYNTVEQSITAMVQAQSNTLYEYINK
jgi:hypothetical protein